MSSPDGVFFFLLPEGETFGQFLQRIGVPALGLTREELDDVTQSGDPLDQVELVMEIREALQAHIWSANV